MAKFNITDNLGDLGSRVWKEEIRLLLPVAEKVLPGPCEDSGEDTQSVEEVTTGEGGLVREGVNNPPGRA